ncbi:MAG: sulfatase [Terrimicrobiaceae bacterium]
MTKNLSTCAVLTAALPLVGMVAPTVFAAESEARRPNVLFIVIDDLNDWVGALDGHPNALTPNIDRLARKGVVFLDAHASSPICGPSRAALLSGIRASTSGLHDNLTSFTDHPKLVENENLPQFFKRLGYRTYGAGKVFHEYYPQFWDESTDKGPRMYKAGQPKQNGLEIAGIFDWGPLDLPEEKFDDYRVAQWAIDKINAPGDAPFFLACGIYLPHLPYYAPRAYFDKFPIEDIARPEIKPGDTDDLPKKALSIVYNKYQDVIREWGSEIHLDAARAYMACTNFADAQVGRVLDALKASGKADSTIVVLFGDNGVHHGQKNYWHKDTLWRQSTRVPLVIYVPGMAGNGTPTTRVASLIDIYPTLADLLGVEAPQHLEGRSLKPLLENPQQDWPYSVVTNRRPGEYAIRNGKWCYINYGSGSEELYDRVKDPQEWTNLANQPEFAEIKTQLSKEAPASGNQ